VGESSGEEVYARHCLTADLFTFGVFDQNGNELARATNDALGNIVFPALTFTQACVTTYTMRGLNPSSNGWEMDTRSFPVIITITDDGNENLTATISYPDGQPPTFINRYCPPVNC
jgi:pilin isopeptide linkage protein